MSMHAPSLQAPIASAGGAVSPVWAKFFRELIEFRNAEMAPGRIALFYLASTTLTDPACFVQSGATAGLGVGEYLGWKVCNGNNGTPTPGETFVRLSTTEAGATGGSDTAAASTTGSTVLTVNQIPSHNHQIEATYAMAAGGDQVVTPGTNYAAGATTGARGGGLGHDHTTPSHDNRPAFFSWVALMRT